MSTSLPSRLSVHLVGDACNSLCYHAKTTALLCGPQWLSAASGTPVIMFGREAFVLLTGGSRRASAAIKSKRPSKPASSSSAAARKSTGPSRRVSARCLAVSSNKSHFLLLMTSCKQLQAYASSLHFFEAVCACHSACMQVVLLA